MDKSFARGVLPRLLIMVLFVVLSAVGVVFSVLLLLTATTIYMYFLAACFAALSITAGFLNFVSANFYYKSYFYDGYLAKLKEGLAPVRNYPTVAVAMPVYNEDPAMVERNLRRLRELDYERGKVTYYVLDDSTDPEARKAIELASRRNGAVYLHRRERKGFKAGALNNLLMHSREEFLAVFDSDEYITDVRFLKDMVPYFRDGRVAFVQTEKRYAKGTFFSDSIDLFDAIFFKFIQTSRALNGTAIFAGSCGMIRRSALDEIGGFPEFVTEDTFFSFESDMSSFKSVYLPKVYALGKPLLTFTELARQQWRYNYGDTQFLGYLFKAFKKEATPKKRGMSASSKIDYVAHGFGLNYISGVLILFSVVSMLVVLSAAPFAASASLKQILLIRYPLVDVELLAAAAFSLSILTPAVITKVYFGSFSKGLMLFVLNFALSFTRLKAAIAAVLKNSPMRGWIKGDGLKAGTKLLSSFRNSAAELSFSGILLVAGIAALVASNLFGGLWLLWYSMLYGSTFFFFFKYG
jgi:cellulose synthase/poly-beta-1,6-N-acetylglucosamine synthase-like glycosyltransferase